MNTKLFEQYDVMDTDLLANVEGGSIFTAGITVPVVLTNKIVKWAVGLFK